MSLARTALIFALAGSAALAATALPPEQAEFFENKIRPVLASECYECHDAKKQKGGDSGDALLQSAPAWQDFAQSLFNAKEFIFLR